MLILSWLRIKIRSEIVIDARQGSTFQTGAGVDQIYENLLIAGIQMAEFTFLAHRCPTSKSNWVQSIATFSAWSNKLPTGIDKANCFYLSQQFKSFILRFLSACFLHHPSQRAACYLVNPIFMGFALRLAPLNKLKMFFGVASQDDFEAAVLNIFSRSREFSWN